MNEHRIRLPVAGDRRARATEAELKSFAEEDARKPLPAPSVAIAGAGAIDFAHALREELMQSGRQFQVWFAETRVRAGSELTRGKDEEWVLRASPNEMDAALQNLTEQSSEAAAMTIAVGVPFIAWRRATLSVHVTRGVPLLEWDGTLRDMRGRFDIVMADPRPMLARELVSRLVRS